MKTTIFMSLLALAMTLATANVAIADTPVIPKHVISEKQYFNVLTQTDYPPHIVLASRGQIVVTPDLTQQFKKPTQVWIHISMIVRDWGNQSRMLNTLAKHGLGNLRITDAHFGTGWVTVKSDTLASKALELLNSKYGRAKIVHMAFDSHTEQQAGFVQKASKYFSKNEKFHNESW